MARGNSSHESADPEQIVGLTPADIAAIAGPERLDLPGWGSDVEPTMISNEEMDEIFAERKRLNKVSETLPKLHFQNGIYGGPTARAAYVDSLLSDRDTTPTEVDTAVQRSPEGLPDETSAIVWLLEQGYKVEQYVAAKIARVEQAFLDGQITAHELVEQIEQTNGPIADPVARQEHLQFYVNVKQRYETNKPKFDHYRERGLCIEDHTTVPSAILLDNLLAEGKLVMVTTKPSLADSSLGKSSSSLIFRHPLTGDFMRYAAQYKDPRDWYDRQPELEFFDQPHDFENIDFNILTAVSRPQA